MINFGGMIVFEEYRFICMIIGRITINRCKILNGNNGFLKGVG
jgi:hypothetical protein